MGNIEFKRLILVKNTEFEKCSRNTVLSHHFEKVDVVIVVTKVS